MNKYGPVITASIITVVVACTLFARITVQKKHFDNTVKIALNTTEGYDQQFIDMVNRLERELALRASFGYIGGKDPMTGKERIVVTPPAPQHRKTRERIAGTGKGTLPPAITIPKDSVRLTAIIYDDTKKLHTAIIMVGERSYAIESGDNIIGRHVNAVNDSLVILQSGPLVYSYDIRGNVEIK